MGLMAPEKKSFCSKERFISEKRFFFPWKKIYFLGYFYLERKSFCFRKKVFAQRR